MPVDKLHYWWYTVFAATAAIGLMLNSFIVLSNAPYVKKLPPSSFLIFWLCTFDTLAILNNIIEPIHMLAHNTSEYNSLICQIHGAFAVTFNISSLQLCFGLTLFRYLVIVHQIQVPRVFPAVYTCYVTLISLVVGLLPFMLSSQRFTYDFGASNLYCAPDWTQQDTGSMLVTWLCFSIAVGTLLLLVYAYGAIFIVSARVVKEFQKSLDGAGVDNTVQLNPCAVSASNLNRSRSNSPSKTAAVVMNVSAGADAQKRAELDAQQSELMKQSLIMVTAFLLGWSPYLIMGIYEFFTQTQVSPEFDFFASMSITIYDVINPVIVYIYDREIRRLCRRALSAMFGS
ncbi:hypothetical protein CcCBS67573_g08487 [Chytriomyces confervae]|uniref:G-protein coupled receptors family 1 profile domain-containing protein n=1 Tax=Chytriomyces confervae TaxID=246404 RepID=A0A507EJW6_9FUNG|nr:hypothetical protein CcCBS67573_g08487 [Chytriomyces confervae]